MENEPNYHHLLKYVLASKDQSIHDGPQLSLSSLCIFWSHMAQAPLPRKPQCLWAVGKHLRGRVPVPEVYGWRRDGNDVFIYMELVQGQTLAQRWESLTDTERVYVCNQLRSMVQSLRTLNQDRCRQFIGSFGGGSTTDVSFDYCPSGGPFPSCKVFLDWFSTLNLGKIPKHPNARPDPYRKDLPDNAAIIFTHNDPHHGNIIVSAVASPEIRAIIDWHQSGWYPEYWEYCKAQFTANPESS